MSARFAPWAPAVVILASSMLGAGCLASDDDVGGAGGAGGDGGAAGSGASGGSGGTSGTGPCAARSPGCDQPDLKQCLEDHSNPLTPEVCDLLGGEFRAEGCPRAGLVGYCADVLTTGEPDATQYYYVGRPGIEDLEANCRFGPTWCEP